MTGPMERKSEVLEELENLKLENHHQSQVISALKCKISQKEREIDRFRTVLEIEKEGNVSSKPRECCFQCREKDKKIRVLEEQLEASVMKQHEAMSRALNLAERNQKLERELKDIDDMALAVEQECQNKIKQNFRNVEILQEKLKQKMIEIKKLEDKIMDMKNTMEKGSRELNNVKTEKKLLEKNLTLAANEKKNLNEKLNHYLLKEKKLTGEVSRLQEMNKSLQRQLADMGEKVTDILGNPKGKQKQLSRTFRVPPSKADPSQCVSDAKSLTGDKSEKLFAEDDVGCVCDKSNNFMDKLKKDKNFYGKECHCSEAIHLGHDALVRQFRDQERELHHLKRENCALLRRFECGDHLSCSSGDSMKIILDRLEKERDMALSDISRLQGERDALREKIKLVNDSQFEEHSRLQRIVMENEERIRRLESERRELISNQSSQRIALAAAEEKLDEYKEQIRSAETALAQVTANYNQLKTLQEQTDRTLSDVQERLSEAGVELRFARSKIKELENEKEELMNEISSLKKEKSSLKSNLAQTEKEKDALLITLDEKTEKAAKLEHQLKTQETYVSELTEKISLMEKKFEYTITEKTNREHGIRTLERAVEHLKEELEKSELQKEALIKENRRLQDDLASAAKDCLTSRRDLDSEKQEVENLKKQLQQYVSEVKRAEELLTKKESERNQMLDHFRSLSLEATALETNNHTLESTVENTKTQLTSANNKIMHLEQEILSKDSLLCNYEKQIAELTTQIAEMETKLKQEMESKTRTETDLTALRDLCSAIDSQKEALRRQASVHDAEKTQLVNEVRRLSEEYEDLNQKLSYERNLSETLEKSLSNSRQETLEHKITNKDLQSQVQSLRLKVDELTRKLELECEDVRRYQAQCTELSRQVSELRREVTNARFEQAKAVEDSKRNFIRKFHEEEEIKEIRFESDVLGKSARNVPPLTFSDRSEPSPSFDSEFDYLKFISEDPEIFSRKLQWKLSPLEEDPGSAVSPRANTASELSSLPEDRDLELSVPPTYSVRKASGSVAETYDVPAAQNSSPLDEISAPSGNEPECSSFPSTTE